MKGSTIPPTIQYLRICCAGRERLSANDAAADTFCIEFQKFVPEENLKLDQICIANESGSYWKGLPTRTLAFERENCAPRHEHR
jgi:hypothetical protein